MTVRAGAESLPVWEGAPSASAAVPLVLVLEGNIPSKKNRYRMGGGNFFKDKKTVVWEKSAALQLIAQRGKWAQRGCPLAQTLRVAMRFTYATRRGRDTINSAETVLDMLTKSGILEDDNFKVIPSLELSGAYEKGVDRCVVEIWPGDGLAALSEAAGRREAGGGI